VKAVVVGAGLMGAQIGLEYALGGHDVTLVARDTDRVRDRLEAALALVSDHALAPAAEVERAAGRLAATDTAGEEGWELVVESLPEDLELKVALLRPLAAGSPEAIIASNTSSLSITELGERIGAPERTLGTHYWNPPLLMPLVEVVAGTATDDARVALIRDTLATLGKRPVVVRDVPGFVWNRLQMAILREATWLVENGIASPETIDEVLTYGLARRWRHVGFFRAIALGGVDTWQQTASNLLPELSSARKLGDLRRWVTENGDLAEVARRRDRGLAEDLILDRGGRNG
jgi:3-hydroxybutyryl-CoA dehydrogenase